MNTSPDTSSTVHDSHRSVVLVANRHLARLRKIERSDLSALEGLERTAALDSVPHVPLTASNIVALHDAGWTIQVAVEPIDGRVVGYVVYGLIDMKRVWIERVVVDRDFRKRGVGRQLVLHAVQWAVEIQANDVAADVPQSATAAQCLMRHCRFRVPRALAHVYRCSSTEPFHFVRALS